LEWLFKTFGGQEYAVDVFDWEFTRVLDASRPSEARLVASRNDVIIPKGWVRAVEDSQTRFIGYVSRRPGLSGSRQTVECKGVEQLLWNRYCGRYGYMGSLAGADGVMFTRLAHIFNSDSPNQGYDRYQMKGCIGLIWYANSKIPHGFGQRRRYVPLPYDNYPVREAHGPIQLFYASSSIMRLPGGGKLSRLGTSNIYINGSLFPEVASFANLAASSDMGIYRDDLDLYLKISDTSGTYIGDYKNNSFLADNAFDTKIRAGLLDNPDDDLYGPLDLDHTDTFGDAFLAVAELHNKNIRWRYGNDYLCYMDVLNDFSDDGLFSIKEEDCDRVEQESNTSLVPDALIGLGYGSKYCRQIHSAVDLSAPYGAFIEKNYEIKNGFADVDIVSGVERFGNMYALMDAAFVDERGKDIITISGKNFKDLIPGNAVALALRNEQIRNFEVSKVQLRKDNAPTISLGNRASDILDAMRALKESSDVYIDKSMVEIGYTSVMSGDITIGDLDTADTAFTTASFTLPSRPVATDRPRFILDIGIRPKDGSYDKPVYCTLWVCMASATGSIDSYWIMGGGSQWYLLGDTFNGIDATDNCNWGGANYVRVHCRYRGYWDGAAPVLTCTVKGTCFGRYDI
jgi:hypothetical protein